MHKSALENNTSKCQKTKHKAIITSSIITNVFLKCEALQKIPLCSNVVHSKLCVCRNPSFGLATKARGCKVAGQVGDPGAFHMLPGAQRVWGNEPSHSQVNSHVGSWSPKRTPESSERDCRGQNSSPWGVLYIIGKLLKCRCLKLGSHGSFGHLKHKLWAKERPRVKLPVWLPTTKSRESTRFTWLQMTCHIPLESSWQELQLCFRLHFDPRSDRKVMGLQSPGSPRWRDFGTPTRESRERKAIWMQAPWRVTKNTIRGKVVASPKSGPWWILCVNVARGSS
jgi:hypothetical protein